MDSSLLPMLLTAWGGTALAMVLAWVVQRVRGNAAVVDVAWCLCFALVATWYAWITIGVPARRVLVAAMAVIWGFRLAGYVLTDRIVGKEEDARYAMLRNWSGKWAQGLFLLLYQIEALALPLFSLPLLILMQNPDPVIRWWEWIGLVVWIVAMAGEWIADWQLARFRRNPNNRGFILKEGLWKYSRHPNYFFESVHWWAYVIMAAGLPNWWITLLGPFLMTLTLVGITGIPFAELAAVTRRGAAYREYQRTTSAFIPWLPRKKRYNSE